MMGAEEVASVIQEQGSVEVQCDFATSAMCSTKATQKVCLLMRRPMGQRRRCIKERPTKPSWRCCPTLPYYPLLSAVVRQPGSLR